MCAVRCTNLINTHSSASDMDEEEEDEAVSPLFLRSGSQVWADLFFTSAPTSALDYVAP